MGRTDASDPMPANVSLDDIQREEAWDLYERTGSMAEVARLMNVSAHHIRSALLRDPIRLMDVRIVRIERSAARWEEQEGKCAATTGKMLDIVWGIIRHIEACKESGQETTDLINSKVRGGPKMSVTEAYQWLIETGMLDSVGRVGLNAARVVESMKMLGDQQAGLGSGMGGMTKDPSIMGDDELERMVADLEAAGRPLPWGVEQWKKARQKRLGHALDTAS